MYTKKVLVALSSLMLTVAATPAIAGPDWTAIEHARTAKKAEQKSRLASGKAEPARQSRISPRGPRATAGA